MAQHVKQYNTLKEFINDYETQKLKQPYVVVIGDRFTNEGKPVVLYSSRGHYKNLIKHE